MGHQKDGGIARGGRTRGPGRYGGGGVHRLGGTLRADAFISGMEGRQHGSSGALRSAHVAIVPNGHDDKVLGDDDVSSCMTLPSRTTKPGTPERVAEALSCVKKQSGAAESCSRQPQMVLRSGAEPREYNEGFGGRKWG